MQNYANNENYEYVFSDSTLTQIHIIICYIYYYCVQNKFITHGIPAVIYNYYTVLKISETSIVTISIWYTNTETDMMLLYFRYRKWNVFQKKKKCIIIIVISYIVYTFEGFLLIYVLYLWDNAYKLLKSLLLFN
jgi:hypothetical protein